MTRPLALLTLLCLTLTTAGCAVNPATGGANLVLMTENKEKEIGQAEGAIAFLRELEQADAIVVRRIIILLKFI